VEWEEWVEWEAWVAWEVCLPLLYYSIIKFGQTRRQSQRMCRLAQWSGSQIALAQRISMTQICVKCVHGESAFAKRTLLV
jgi:hypothetical protein